MYLAEEMRMISNNALNEETYEALKKECLKRMRNLARFGRKEMEFSIDYSDPAELKQISENTTYWEKLKTYLEDEGFNVFLKHYLGPGKYGYALEINWR